METRGCVKFWTLFVEHLQDVCRNSLDFNKFVEVSGYVCVEIDNMKKERYVLSELLQSSGNVVSESFKVLTSGSQRVRRESQHRPPAEKKSQNHRAQDDSHDRTRQPRQQHQAYNPQFHSERQQRIVSSQRLGNVSETDTDAYVTSASSVSESLPQLHHVGSSWNQDAYSEGDYGYKSSGDHLPQSCVSHLSTVPGRSQMLQHDSEVATSMHQVSGCVVDRAPSCAEDEEVIDLDMVEDDDEDEDVSILPIAMQEDDLLRYGTGSGKSQLSPGTLSTVRNSVKQFKKFIFDRSGLDTDLFSTPPERLNRLLLDYFHEAKKVGGGELTARTLKNLQVRLDMFLKDGGYQFSIIKDKQFQSSRDYLKQKLSESGKSITPLHSPIDENDIEILFQANQLGVHSYEVIINTMWFLNSKYFAIRRPAEHFNMKWGDLTLEVDDQGQEYVSRPIQGAMFLKVFAKPEFPNRCFVNCYKQYRAMRPKQMMDQSCPFYLKIGRNPMGESCFCMEAMSYTHFIHIWRKMVLVSRLPSNKKIF